MSLRRLNFMHWPISTKLTVIFLLAVLLPVLLIVVPFSIQRRNTMLREQNEVRLETLGPSQIGQTELALISLSSELERLVNAPTDYDQLERYFYLMRWSSISADVREELDTFIQHKLTMFIKSAPSLSRVRLYDSDGHLLLNAVPSGGVLDLSTEAGEDTPGNTLIQTGQIGPRATVSDIYMDSQGNPSLDIVYTLHPPWNVAGSASIIVGQFIFTQNLQVADPTLPDLYALIQDFPKSEQATHIFLLNAEGQLVMPDPPHHLLDDASNSDGFQRAARGETGVASYRSSLLNTDVIGYHAAVTFRDGPRFIYLIETPISEINRESRTEGLVALLWAGLGTLVLGLISITLGTVVIARPLARLTEAVRQITAGQLDLRLPRLVRQDEIGVLNNAFGEMADQLFNAIRQLESRVAERTRNLELTLEVGRVLTSIRDLDMLFETVVNLIHDRFDKIYHAQVFLIDTQTNRAYLRAATGAPGRILLQRGHFLEIGSQSVIGSVTASGNALVALDATHNPIHKPNEFLPDTRAEMALPLRIGDRIIGALDLQSTLPDAFTEADVELFQGMADQISITIENATLFEESKARLLEIERLNQSLTGSAWREVVQRQGVLSASAGQAPQPTESWSALQQEAMRSGQIAEQVEGDRVTFAVPVLLRDQVMGAIEWQVPQARYTQATRRTALELAGRLALAAENIRLFEQSRQAAQREQVVNQISSKLIGTTDVDQILQTAVRELGLALRTSQMVIRLTPPAPTSDGDEPGVTPPGSEAS